jgi:putative hydrolase of HD superfamily
VSDGGGDGRLDKILAFLEEADRLKLVYRGAHLADHSRSESAAEHVWHLCVFAMLLREESALTPDPLRVLELCLVHDMVEIYAGDTWAYDHKGHKDKEEREERAAEKLFTLLPEDLERRLRGLWDEFEEGRTKEARFAQAMDRLQGFAQIVFGGGRAWRERGVVETETRERVEEGTATDPSLAGAFEILYKRAKREGAWGNAEEGSDRSNQNP